MIEYIDKNKLKKLTEKVIYKNQDLAVDNINDMIKSVKDIFSNDIYLYNLKTPKHNWVEKDTKIVTERIIAFIKEL